MYVCTKVYTHVWKCVYVCTYNCTIHHDTGVQIVVQLLGKVFVGQGGVLCQQPCGDVVVLEFAMK